MSKDSVDNCEENLSSYLNIIVSPSIQLIRSKLPEIVYDMERANQGEIGDYPELTDYVLEVQEFIRNCIGFDSSPTSVTVSTKE